VARIGQKPNALRLLHLLTVGVTQLKHRSYLKGSMHMFGPRVDFTRESPLKVYRRAALLPCVGSLYFGVSKSGFKLRTTPLNSNFGVALGVKKSRLYAKPTIMRIRFMRLFALKSTYKLLLRNFRFVSFHYPYPVERFDWTLTAGVWNALRFFRNADNKRAVRPTLNAVRRRVKKNCMLWARTVYDRRYREMKGRAYPYLYADVVKNGLRRIITREEIKAAKERHEFFVQRRKFFRRRGRR
jgi:hypothetical protein